MTDRPLIAVLDNKDQLLCVTDEYFDGNLHTFLQGTAAFFRCSILQKSDLSQFFIEGHKLSFIYQNKSYHFDITDVVSNEDYVNVQADSLTLELRNEDASEYKATKAMTFEEYLKVFLFAGDNPLVMGVNEVSDKKLQLEWEGSEDDLLARLFSLANKFSAEIEFETTLNQHWGLSEIVLNVYKAHDDKNQGIGNNRQDIILEWGNNVETIEIHKNIDNLKTAIKPVGTDGLTIVGIEIDERDELGNQLFYSSKASAIIYAVQAKEQFTSKVNGEGYIKKNWTYETKNQNTLAGQALAELKKISQVELTVTIKSYEYLEIGDTVRALNTAYKPELNLSVRVSEQDIYFDQPSKNQTTFTNVEILKSEVDTSLLDRVQALIDANKVFTYEIITSDGVTFKNGFGSTTLTARVRDGIKDVTDTFSLKWYKDGTLFSNTKTVTINAADIEEKAVFRFEVADDSGNVRGGAEVTVTNIDDGKKGEPGKSPYNVVLISSNGLLFKNGVLSTAIQAVVFKGDEDVTDLLDANQFKWKKTNGDGTPDEAWNALHAGGVKSVTIGTDDVNKRATFSCDIVEI
ncbi:phage tail protein [Enterococcus casseliflavus]|uniref:phage tail protein n=1 Tax=Enterococcus casseliflavus TaxID=37734 RepID=UPI003D0A842B